MIFTPTCHRPPLPPLVLVVLALLLPTAASAYPPAPYHTLYGLVRDQFGTPIVRPDVQIVLITAAGIPLETEVVPGIAPGVNYQLKVTMDAGLTPLAYKPTAYSVAAAFKLFVIVGGVTNIPIEMTGDFSHLGQPSGSTRLDLTLGIDANGDSIPDAWEIAFLGALGSDLRLSQVNANSVLTSDGHSLLYQYLAGGNPLLGGLTVALVDFEAGAPILQFHMTTGHSYTVQMSTDLQHWTSLPFSIPAENVSGSIYQFYTATSEYTLEVKAILPTPSPQAPFFRIQQQ